MGRHMMNMVQVLAWSLVLASALTHAHWMEGKYCPICNMPAQDDRHFSFRGNQSIYACEMANHMENLRDDASEYFVDMKILPASTVFRHDDDVSDRRCPVCQEPLTSSGSIVDIAYTARSHQHVYACSRAHAEDIVAFPSRYILSDTNVSDVFCTQASVMANGFQWSYRHTCTMLLFHSWVLNTEWKYILACLGLVVAAMALEGWGEIRYAIHQKLHQEFSRRVRRDEDPAPELDDGHNHAFYVPLSDSKSSSREELELMSPGKRSLPIWCRLFLGWLYMCHMALAYLLMLVIMSYEPVLFGAIVLGLGLGFFWFKDTEGEFMSKNIDPCCST